VQARLLLKIFDSVYLFSLATWVGSILFFSFGIAPIIFKVLDANSAAKFVRALFPRYYAWGVVSSGIALPAFLAVPLAFPELRGPMVAVQAMIILASLIIFMHCGQSLTPQINAARDAGPEGKEKFDRLHKLSVKLNAIALVLGIVCLVMFATRAIPKTDGIVEMTPTERLQYESQFQRTFEQAIKDGKSTSPAQTTDTRFPFDDAARKETEEFAKKYRDKEQKRLAKPELKN
jgi:uncharacterized membrane protein